MMYTYYKKMMYTYVTRDVIQKTFVTYRWKT